MEINKQIKAEKYLIKSSRFGDFPYNEDSEQELYKKSKVVIIGIPYDVTSTYQRGSNSGPEAIFSASKNVEVYDADFGNIYEVGIFTGGTIKLNDINTLPDNVINRIYSVCKGFVDDDKFLVSIGGEHSISAGIVKAFKEKYDQISVLQLDAHLDLMNSYGGSKYNHACVMRRIIDDLGCTATQVGIRVTAEEENDYLKQSKPNSNIFKAKDIYNNNDWFQQAIDSLRENVYITLDVDVFDPSLIPATGTPVPGGLGWYQVYDFLKNVFRERNIIGMDVTELKPNPANEAPNFITADLIYRNIGFYKEYALKR